MQDIADFVDQDSLSVERGVVAPNRFVCPRAIRFGHCDPAGIAFYPQYVWMLQEVVEDWWQQALGIDFNAMIVRSGLGCPTVRLDIEFLRPSRGGDLLRFELSVSEVGRSSRRLMLRGEGDDGLRLSAEMKLVMLDIAEHRAVPIPHKLRSRLQRFRTHGGVAST